jgi:hypothetical protein
VVHATVGGEASGEVMRRSELEAMLDELDRISKRIREEVRKPLEPLTEEPGEDPPLWVLDEIKPEPELKPETEPEPEKPEDLKVELYEPAQAVLLETEGEVAPDARVRVTGMMTEASMRPIQWVVEEGAEMTVITLCMRGQVMAPANVPASTLTNENWTFPVLPMGTEFIAVLRNDTGKPLKFKSYFKGIRPKSSEVGPK